MNGNILCKIILYTKFKRNIALPLEFTRIRQTIIKLNNSKKIKLATYVARNILCYCSMAECTLDSQVISYKRDQIPFRSPVSKIFPGYFQKYILCSKGSFVLSPLMLCWYVARGYSK